MVSWVTKCYGFGLVTWRKYLKGVFVVYAYVPHSFQVENAPLWLKDDACARVREMGFSFLKLHYHSPKKSSLFL